LAQRLGEDIYPYMLVNIGSGVSLIKVRVTHTAGAGRVRLVLKACAPALLD
jgi:pantothenate kinase